MGRVYEASFNEVSVSAVQDLFMLQTTSGMACKILEVAFDQKSTSTLAFYGLVFRRFSGSYAAGSGGSSATINKHNFGDAGATCTVGVNETTPTAISSGAQANIRNDVFNIINGYEYFWPQDKEIIMAPSQAFCVYLEDAPGSAINISGALVFEELF